MPNSVAMPSLLNKFTVSRLGRKLTVDDQKLLVALPKDVIPERIWAEVLQKEDTELFILEIREEIVEDALKIGYERYMDRQTGPFTVHCAAQAWLKLIDWHFFKHDPGEDPSSNPPCFIPRRVESWIPDEMPDPSPKDSWGRHNLEVAEEIIEETLRKWPSSQSLDFPIVEEIPKECCFPGKVLMPEYMEDESYYDTITFDESVSSDMATESELLQKVTNYTPSPAEISIKESTTITFGSPKDTDTTDNRSSLQGGGGDSAAHHKIRSHSTKSKISNRSRYRQQQSTTTDQDLDPTGTDFRNGGGDACSDTNKMHLHRKKRNRHKSRSSLSPLQPDSQSKASMISDCRLRNLRLDTQYEISSEKIVFSPKINAKRK